MRLATQAVLAALAVLLAAPAPADDVADRIREGVRLHDAKDYDGAILAYERVLSEHPHHPQAVFEKAFSMVARGKDQPATIAFIESELASEVAQTPRLYTILGWAYDDLGQLDKGEAAFRRGLDAAPKTPDLHYNLAVNLALQKRWSEAIASYVEALAGRPTHASAWFGLANALEKDERPPRAFVAYARVVTLEPESERGRKSAERLWPLLFAGVQRQQESDPTSGPGDVTITIDAGTTGSDDEPDPLAMESMTNGMVAALRHTDDWKDKSDAAFFANALESVLAIGSEPQGKADPFWSVALPFFDAARKKGHVEAMAHVMRHAAGDAEAGRWLEKNGKRAKAYSEWAAAWTPPKSE